MSERTMMTETTRESGTSRTRPFRGGTGLLTLAVWVASAVLPLSAAAQIPYLVRDIRLEQANFPSIAPPFPVHFVTFKGRLYFIHDDGVHGRELWSTDGSEEGTGMVRDICPGQCSGRFYFGLVAVGNSLFFPAIDAVHGEELWVTDGSREGTRLVRDLRPGPASGEPRWLTAVGKTLFFVADDGVHGRELWRSDGTAEGTTLVADILPGPAPTYSFAPADLVSDGQQLFFQAEDGVHGRELWVSDGTGEGTRMVVDLGPGAASGVQGDSAWFPGGGGQMAVFRGEVYFTGDDGIHGWEVWKSDGTSEGTTLVQDVNPGPGSSTSQPYFRVIRRILYFRAYDDERGTALGRTDGTPEGTYVLDLRPDRDSSAPFILGEVQGGFVLIAYDAAHGRELWRSDGTVAGTSLLADIQPGPASGISDFYLLYYYFSANLGESVFFEADDGVHGLEWWVSDGTSDGTHLVADIHSGPLPSYSLWLKPAVFHHQLYLFAYDEEAGWEPWITDGTEAGTYLLGDFNRQTSSVIYPSYFGNVGELEAAEERLFFRADDGEHGFELWASDGSEGGTHLVVDLYPGSQNPQFPNSSFPTGLAGLGPLVFFDASGVENNESFYGLFRSNGDASGTFQIIEGGVQDRVAFSGGLLFDRYTQGLWWSDGTAAAPYLLTDEVEATNLTAGKTTAYFRGTTDDSAALWATDGTPSGTRELAVLGIGAIDHCFDSSQLAVTPSDRVYFAADDGTTGCEPWVSDGTGGGAHQIADLDPGPVSSLAPSPSEVENPIEFSQPTSLLATLGERALFAADDGIHGREPWITAGIESGTHLLGDLCPGPCSSFPRRLTAALGTVYFAANDGTVGEELWVTDGTPAGTRLVRDLLPGPESGVPHFLTEVDDHLYFAAVDGERGVELWRSDGTAGGTQLVSDINPGPGSSSPEFLTFSCPNLAFAATDGVRGFEPWMLPIYQGREVVVSDRTFTGFERITACDTVATEGAVVVTGGGDLTFRAGQRIALGDGFAVLAGGRLTLRVDRGVYEGKR